MKATKTLYISKSKSSHDQRFVETLSQVLEIDEFYIDSDPKYAHLIMWAEYSLIIASPLSTGVSIIPEDTTARIIGICMAYEINEEAKDLEKFVEVYRNINRCKAIVCDSQYIRNLLIEKFHFTGDILRIAYGCNQRDFASTEFQEYEVLKIVSLRNWTKIHSNDTTLKALEKAHEKGLYFIASFYGTGEELSQRTIHEAMSKMQKHVNFQGAYTQEDLPSILANSEVFVSSSISDGASVSLLEAMTAGRICICRDFPTNRELISHGKNGFLFNSEAELTELFIHISNLEFKEKNLISIAAKTSMLSIANWSRNRIKLQNFATSWINK